MKFLQFRLFILLILFGIFQSIQSCSCTEMYCFGADDLTTIEINNFDVGLLDSISIVKYELASGFSSSLDTFSTGSTFGANGDSSSVTLFVDERLEVEYNYRLIFTDGQTFDLSNWVVGNGECNKSVGCGDPYRTLDSYQVNGVVKAGATIVIDQ